MRKFYFILFLTAFIFVMPVQVYASRPREVQYSHALSRAISRNPDIIPLERAVRDDEALARELLADYLATVNADRDAAAVIYGQRMMILADRDRTQREIDRHRVTTESDLRTHLRNIASLEANLEILETSLALQSERLGQMELRHSHGMASDMELSAMGLAVEQLALNLDMLNLNLVNERQQLNLLIHQPITANIQVVYEIGGFEAVPVELTDRQLQRMFDRDHSLLHWQDQADISRHEWQRQLGSPEISQLRLQHQLNVMERDLAERMAELNVRNNLAYWDRTLEHGLALEADLAQAQADYENMLNRLAAGLVVQLDVDMTALAVSEAEAQIARHGYDLWIVNLRAVHPYLR